MLESKIRNQKSEIRNILLVIFVCFICTAAFAEEQFTYDSKGKRNPFIPLLTSDGRLINLDKEAPKGDLIVEGIIFDKKGRSYAIVNGEVVGIGDAVAGYEILKIENDKVVFIKESKITEIKVNKEGE
jgi:type II secretory pathway component PulC